MYRLHDRICCSDCKKSYIDVNLGSPGQIKFVRKSRCTL